jgi:hypothetical protein
VKKLYEAPSFEFVEFSKEDALITSDCYYDDSCEGCDVECTNKCLREGTYNLTGLII